MLRHKRNTHPDNGLAVDKRNSLSDSEESMDDDDDIDSEDSGETGASEGDDVWGPLIKIVVGELQSQYEDKVKSLMASKDVREIRARSDVYKEMRPIYRRAVIKRFLTRLVWFNSLKRDTVYQAIRDTVQRLRSEEAYGRQEALQYATSKRKYLFDKLLSDYIPPEIGQGGDEDGGESD